MTLICNKQTEVWARGETGRVLTQWGVSSLAMRQRRLVGAFAEAHDRAEDNRVRMALDHFLDQAVERRERVGEDGAPVESVIHSAASKRRGPCTPLRPLKVWASASCRAASRLIENAPASRNPASVEDERARQTNSVGGASEREASDVIVQPRRTSPSPQAMIATPEDSARIACRKAAGSAWRSRRSLTLSPR